MNSSGITDNKTLNSCQYTPVYLIQNNSITQARSYVIGTTIQEEPRPVTNNLKLFYENSGNIENSVLLNNVQYIPNPPTHNKPIQENSGNIENGVLLNSVQYVPSPPTTNQQIQEQPLGNNLKLASFLVPKKDANKQQYYATITNKILKPTVSSGNTSVLPNINIVTSKSNGAKSRVNAPRTLLKPRILPKIKPKEKIPEASNHTSVHLLKLGGTYHSLNQLNDKQMRIVNQALDKIQRQDPEKTKLKPSYDPVSNTRIIYKVVSPNDLKVVGKNKITIKASGAKKEEIKKDINKEETDSEEEKTEPVAVIKVTRSGRTVKLPKHIQETQEGPPSKAKKKINTVVACYQCSAEFSSIYKLQRHYELQPTHIPSNIHTSLFHCLLAMVQDGAEEHKPSIFINQLKQLIQKLKAVLPCLLKRLDGIEGTAADINEDIGRLFGLSPGKYTLNMEALDCVKDHDEHCKHNPPKQTQFKSELSKPSQLWLSKHQEEIANISSLPTPPEGEGEDCARIQPVDKWPVNRVWKRKQDKAENKIQNKKVKITCDMGEPIIELGSETFENIAECSTNKQLVTFISEDNTDDDINTPLKEQKYLTIVSSKKNKRSHKQFYSTHFDIRSSPIKPSSTVFNKIQIIPEKVPLKLDAQILRPLTFETKTDQNPETILETNCENSLDLNGILKDLSPNDQGTIVGGDELITNNVSCKVSEVLKPLSFDDPKQWSLNSNSSIEQPPDNCMKSNSLIIPAMMHVQDRSDIIPTNYDSSNFNDRLVENNFDDNAIANNDNPETNGSIINDNQEALNQGSSVLNFLESLGNELTCPETELRNNSMDFPLDLFSFNHS